MEGRIALKKFDYVDQKNFLSENVRRDEGEVSPLAGHCNVCGVSPVCHHRRVAMSITIVNVVRTTQVSVPLCKRCFEVANKADFMALGNNAKSGLMSDD